MNEKAPAYAKAVKFDVRLLRCLFRFCFVIPHSGNGGDDFFL